MAFIVKISIIVFVNMLELIPHKQQSVSLAFIHLKSDTHKAIFLELL